MNELEQHIRSYIRSVVASKDLYLEEVGRRYYVKGKGTYAAKDTLKAQGLSWDSREKAWWTGKKEVAQKALEAALKGSSSSEEGKPSRTDTNRILGKAEYKGKSYYIVWSARTSRGTDAFRLLFMDGTKTFWAGARDVRATKTYRKPRTLRELQEYAQAAREGLTYKDYQAEIDWAEELDNFDDVARLERMGYRGWLAEKKRNLLG